MPKYSAKAWNLYFRNFESTKMSKNGVSVFLVIISEKCTLDILYIWSILAVDKLLIQKNHETKRISAHGYDVTACGHYFVRTEKRQESYGKER